VFKEVFDPGKVRFCPKFTVQKHDAVDVNIKNILDQDILKLYEE
jgi:hypothetical protein